MAHLPHSIFPKVKVLTSPSLPLAPHVFVRVKVDRCRVGATHQANRSTKLFSSGALLFPTSVTATAGDVFHSTAAPPVALISPVSARLSPVHLRPN